MRRPTSAQSQDCAARTCSGHRRRLAMKKLSRMSSTLTIGLDLADVWSDWVAIDADGVVAARERGRTSEPQLRRGFGHLSASVIALEVGTPSAWVRRLLESGGQTVTVADPHRLVLFHARQR